jgi:hypothetical protein
MGHTVRNYLFLDAAVGSKCDSCGTVKNYLGLNAAAAGGKLGADVTLLEIIFTSMQLSEANVIATAVLKITSASMQLLQVESLEQMSH